MARKEREVKDLVTQDDSNYIGSNLPVTQSDFDALALQRKMLKSFVAKQLRVDVDFGVITGTPKPSLFKPGAEKLNKVFGLGARFVQTDREVDRQGNYAAYTYKCEIYHLKTGKVVAECEGMCNSHEKKYKERAIYEWKNKKKVKVGAEPTPIADIQNTLMKMAQKRAMVGATILATGASDFFTQDMEDYDDGPGVDISANEAPENKSRFADDERTKKINGLIESCRKVGISQDDICRKFGLKKADEITDTQASELAGYGRQIRDGEKKVADIFTIERKAD